MKCPGCGDTIKQDRVGEVLRPAAPLAAAAPILYRCIACGRLYVIGDKDPSPTGGG